MNDAKDLTAQAIRALKAGRKEEAYRLFSEVVDLDPTNEDALFGKAGCSSDLDETILLLQKILAMNPSNEKAKEGLEWARARKVKIRPEALSLTPQEERLPPARRQFAEALPDEERQLPPGVNESMPVPPKDRRFSRFWIGLALLGFVVACGVLLIIAVSMSSRLSAPITFIREARASPVPKPPMPRELKTYMQVITESIDRFEAVLDKRYEFQTQEECGAVYQDEYAPLLLQAAAMYYGSEGTAFSPEDVGQGVPTEAIAIHKELLDTYEWFSSPLGELCGQLYFDSQGLETTFGPNPSAAQRQWWETRYDSIDANWVLSIASLEKIKTELDALFSPYEEGQLFDAFLQSGTSGSTLTPRSSADLDTELDRLIQRIAQMRGVPALDLQTLLGLDPEEFRRLQLEAPETLTAMLMRRLGEVTKDLEPGDRRAVLEGLLQQYGIEDPGVIDQLVAAIMEHRIEIRGAALVEPTPTPSPTRTPTPTATPPPEMALPYSDDFSDPSSGWDVNSDERAEVGYSDGEYYFLVHDTNSLAFGNPGRTFTDFRLEVDARKVAGPDDNGFGVIVRRRDSDNFYMFVITSNGNYGVEKLVNDEWEFLVEWNTSPHINQGQGTNHLTLIAQGPNFSFYVNGEHLVDVWDASFAEGDIGLLAGTADEADVRIHFDNLEVWRPRYPALGWETIYDPDGASSVDYPTDKWELDDRTLSHLSLPGCTLNVFPYAHGIPFEWESREYDVPVRLGEHQFLRRAWAVRSATVPRFVGYKLDEPGRDVLLDVLFDIVGSEALDNNPGDFAICQEDAEAVIASLTVR